MIVTNKSRLVNIRSYDKKQVHTYEVEYATTLHAQLQVTNGYRSKKSYPQLDVAASYWFFTIDMLFSGLDLLVNYVRYTRRQLMLK